MPVLKSLNLYVESPKTHNSYSELIYILLLAEQQTLPKRKLFSLHFLICVHLTHTFYLLPNDKKELKRKQL